MNAENEYLELLEVSPDFDGLNTEEVLTELNELLEVKHMEHVESPGCKRCRCLQDERRIQM